MDPSKPISPHTNNGTSHQESLSFLANVATSHQFSGLGFPSPQASDVHNVISSSLNISLNNSKLAYSNAMHTNHVSMVSPDVGDNINASLPTQSNAVFATQSIPVSSTQNMSVFRGVPMIPYSQVTSSLHPSLVPSTSTITTLTNKSKTDLNPYSTSLSLSSAAPSLSNSLPFHGVYSGQHTSALQAPGHQNFILQQPQFDGITQNTGMIQNHNTRLHHNNQIHLQQQQQSPILLQHQNQVMTSLHQQQITQSLSLPQHHQQATQCPVWPNTPVSLATVDSCLPLSAANSMVNNSPVTTPVVCSVAVTHSDKSSGFCTAKSTSMSTSDANQCSEVFNTIREALSVAHNNLDAASTTSIYPDDSSYLVPSSNSSSNLAEAPGNQLSSFTFLTTSPYQLTCRHCNFSTDFHLVFTRHMACHYADKGYECPLCSIVCNSEQELKQHVNLQHLNNRPICDGKLDAKEPSVANETQKTGGNMDVSSSYCVEKEDATKWAGEQNNIKIKPKLPKKQTKSLNKKCLDKKLTNKMNETGTKTLRKSQKKNKNSLKNSNSGKKTFNKFSKEPLSQCLGDKLMNKKLPDDAQYEDTIYRPIDPIATTNKSLSYVDFYKRQSFMSINNNTSNVSSNNSFMHTQNGNFDQDVNTNFRNVQCQNITSMTLPNMSSRTSNMLDQTSLNNLMASHATNSSNPTATNLMPTTNTGGDKQDGFCPYPLEHLAAQNNYLCNEVSGTYNYQSEPLPLIVAGKSNTQVDSRNMQGNSFNLSNQATYFGNQPVYENPNGAEKSSISEHITVKIDPFDFAPSMTQKQERQPSAASYRTVNRDQNVQNLEKNSSRLANEESKYEVSRNVASKKSSLKDSSYSPEPSSCAIRKPCHKNQNLTSHKNKDCKTQTSKYSVNFPITKKDKRRTRVKSVKKQKNRNGSYRSSGTYINKHYAGSQNCREPRGEPCTIDDIIDRTVGMGRLKMLTLQPPNSCANNEDIPTNKPNEIHVQVRTDENKMSDPARVKIEETASTFQHQEVTLCSHDNGFNGQDFGNRQTEDPRSCTIVKNETSSSNDASEIINVGSNGASELKTTMSDQTNNLQAVGLYQTNNKKTGNLDAPSHLTPNNPSPNNPGSARLDPSSPTSGVRGEADPRRFIYLCKICGFETHYELVFARHAPSHRKPLPPLAPPTASKPLPP